MLLTDIASFNSLIYNTIIHASLLERPCGNVTTDN